MTALASVIVAAEKQVTPYFEEIMSKLLACLSSDKDEIIQAKTVIAIGRLANAVGKEKFQPYLEPISQQVMNSLKESKLLEVAEAGFSYFADIAKILKHEFAPLLPTLVPLVIKSCISDDGINIEYKKDEGDIIDLGSDDEEKEMQGMAVNTASLDERCAALFAMGSFALSCPKDFLPHMDNCLKALEVINDFINETVRSQAIQTYADLVEGLNLAGYGSDTQPKFIVGLPATIKLAPDAHKLYYEVVLPLFVKRIKEDESIEVVGKVLEALIDLCEHIGPAVIEEGIQGIFEAIKLVLTCKTVCQSEEEESEEESEKEGEENNDEMIIENVAALIQVIGRICGESIVGYIKDICEVLIKYLSPKKSEADWEIAIGIFAELFNDIPSLIPEYASKILPLCFKFSTVDDDPLIWNSMYCIGTIAKGSKTIAETNMNEMLLALKSGYETAKSQEPKDNAVSSILRLLIIFPDRLPLEIILPAIFNNIPLNGDIRENVNVAKNLILLSTEIYRSNTKYLENALMTCVKCIVDEDCDVKEEDKVLIGKHLMNMTTVSEGTLKEIMSKMNSDEINLLKKYII